MLPDFYNLSQLYDGIHLVHFDTVFDTYYLQLFLTRIYNRPQN